MRPLRTLTREFRVAGRSLRYDLRNRRGSIRLLGAVVVLVAATALVIATGLLGRLSGGGATNEAAEDGNGHSGQPAGMAEQYLNPQASAGFPYLGSPASSPSRSSSRPSALPSDHRPSPGPRPTETSKTPTSSPSPTPTDSASPTESPSPSDPAPSAPGN
ncbi:hypothetical protein AB0I28_03850 [Phytomonospora sp. NPDC050363]|uniref:hypothetical protein n=1 Tax=Phytomonospora sp. NPDC050363 TaxID=3155642 RepID=UPI0033E5330D